MELLAEYNEMKEVKAKVDYVLKDLNSISNVFSDKYDDNAFFEAIDVLQQIKNLLKQIPYPEVNINSEITDVDELCSKEELDALTEDLLN